MAYYCTVIGRSVLKFWNRRSFSSQKIRCGAFLSMDKKSEMDENMRLLATFKKRKDILDSKRTILKILRTDELAEKAARKRELNIPLDEIKEEWRKTSGAKEIAFLAKYYGVFDDLFNGKEFQPTIWLDINYGENLVHRGNIIMPSKCLQKPRLNFDPKEEKYHSLFLVNPEGCFPYATAEVLHWMVINIPGRKLKEGKELEYLPPLPWKGSGLHRFCFALFTQSELLDTKILDKVNANRFEFRMGDFLGKMEALLTPVGLAWFQSQWDESVSESAKKSGVFEPVFEWEHFADPKKCRLDIMRKLYYNRYRIKFTDDHILL